MTRHLFLRRFGIVVVAIVAVGLTSNAPASAGTYVVRSCNVPGYAPTSAALWKWQQAGYTAAFNDCAVGGGFGLDALWLTKSTVSEVLVARPTSGPKSAIRIRRARLWLVARLEGSGSTMYVTTRTNSAAGGVEQTVLFGKPGGDTLSSPYETPLLPEDTTRFRVVLACSVNAPDDCHPGHTRQLEIKAAQVTLAEDVAPAVKLRSGTLTSGGPQTGLRSVGYAVGDQESGVAKVEGLLGDTVVGLRSLASACSYAEFNACPAGDNDELVVDTRGVPDGTYSFRLRVTDAAGNRIAEQAPNPIVVSNGEIASSKLRLVARFVKPNGSTVTAKYGRRLAIRGRLTDSTGHVLGHAQVGAIERRALTGATMRTRLLRTDAKGKFAYKVRARGPSRSIAFEASAQVDGVSAFVRRTLKLRVRAASTLAVSLKGVRVRYSGRIASRPVPAAGKLIVMQGRVPGGTWQTFATRRSNRRGHFAGNYRLRVHRPGVTLQFRVRVPSEASYPYVAGYGPTVTKRVR